jgi:hypothetical protein
MKYVIYGWHIGLWAIIGALPGGYFQIIELQILGALLGARWGYELAKDWDWRNI